MSYREYLGKLGTKGPTGKLGTKGPTGVEGGFERRVCYTLDNAKSLGEHPARG